MTYTRFYSTWKDWPDISTPTTAAAMQHMEDGLINNSSSSINVLTYGADPTGTVDSGQFILNAVQAAWNDSKQPSVFVPAGQYKIVTSINFTTLTLGGGGINGWGFICDPGVLFQDAGAGGSSGATINLTPPSGTQISFSRIQLGRVQGLGAFNTRDAIRMSQINDSMIDIGQAFNAGRYGVYVQAPTDVGTFNNDIRIGNISDSQSNGMVIDGNNTGLAGGGFQGNRVWIGQCNANGANGLVIDSATGQNAELNHFSLGVVENNGSGAGILDSNGFNWIDVTDTNANGFGGYFLEPSAGRVPHVRGFFSDGVNLNSQVADLINFATIPGHIGSPPSVPGTGVEQANPYDRPVNVYVNGGTVSNISIEGSSTGATSGVFMLLPSQHIHINYTGAPTWSWFLI